MEITPYVKNAKKHPDKQLKLIAESIRQFGWQQPIKVGQDNIIIVGHGRWEAYQKYGDGLKPAWIVDKDGKTISGEAETRQLTSAEEKAYRLADNKINESDWEMDRVIDELKELDDEGFDIGVTGFDYDLLLDPEDKDDEVPETPEEPKSKLGDIYELGNHRVLCGDSTKLEDVERLMDGKKADMVFTDPPYNVAVNDESEESLKARNRRTDGLKVANDKMSDESFRAFLSDVFVNMFATMKNGAVAYVCYADSEAVNFISTFKESGFHFGQNVIWNKQQFVMTRKDYHYKHEPILYGWKEGEAHPWYTDRKQTSVWNFDRPFKSQLHPTTKPLELVTYAVTNSSKGDDIIMDLFLGSGSTLIASEKTGRICYGMELDPKYVDVIIQRYVNYTGNTEVKKNGKVEKWYITTQND